MIPNVKSFHVEVFEIVTLFVYGLLQMAASAQLCLLPNKHLHLVQNHIVSYIALWAYDTPSLSGMFSSLPTTSANI